MVSFISMIKEQILETWVDTCMYMHTTRTHTGKCLLSEFKTLNVIIKCMENPVFQQKH